MSTQVTKPFFPPFISVVNVNLLRATVLGGISYFYKAHNFELFFSVVHKSPTVALAHSPK